MRDSLSLLENTSKHGGLGLPNISVKAKCLLIKQTTHILSNLDKTSKKIQDGFQTGGMRTDLDFGIM